MLHNLNKAPPTRLLAMPYLWAMLEKLQQFRLTKYQWAMAECTYLGQVIGVGQSWTKWSVRASQCQNKERGQVISVTHRYSILQTLHNDLCFSFCTTNSSYEKSYPETVIWTEECEKALVPYRMCSHHPRFLVVQPLRRCSSSKQMPVTVGLVQFWAKQIQKV